MSAFNWAAIDWVSLIALSLLVLVAARVGERLSFGSRGLGAFITCLNQPRAGTSRESMLLRNAGPVLPDCHIGTMSFRCGVSAARCRGTCFWALAASPGTTPPIKTKAVGSTSPFDTPRQAAHGRFRIAPTVDGP